LQVFKPYTSGSTEVKKKTRSLLFAVIVIIAILGISAYAVIQNSMTPLSRREDKSVFNPTENMVIQAKTFGGNIAIGSTSGNQIEVIYNVAASYGYIGDIKTSANETTSGGVTTITAKATLSVNQASAYQADLTINLPTSGKYNLTVTTNNGNINIQPTSSRAITAMTYNGNVDVNLQQGTLFEVAASVGNGNITHQVINLNATTDTATRLEGTTVGGDGNLVLALNSGNGNLTIKYLQ
jgi:DUF4097 and DUF4098 domain-containing protein YvlB